MTDNSASAGETMIIKVWISYSSIRDVRIGLSFLFALFLMFTMGCGDIALEPETTAVPAIISTTPDSLSTTIVPMLDPHPTTISSTVTRGSKSQTIVLSTTITSTPEPTPTTVLATAMPWTELTPAAMPATPAPVSIPTLTAQSSEEETDSGNQSYSQPGFTGGELYYGQTLLKERINYADVIARVKLRSVVPAAAKYVYESSGFEFYERAMLFTFDAIEYLKGSGGSELTAIVPDNSNRYHAEPEALEGALRLVTERDMRWDSRQAIVFIKKSEKALTSHQYRFVFGGGSIFTIPAYMIDSKYNKTWLPAASESVASGQATGDMLFLADAPSTGATGQSDSANTSTISLKDLRSTVKKENGIFEAGAAMHGKDAYRECLAEKYHDDRRVIWGVEYSRLDIGTVASGLPAGARVGDPARLGGTPNTTYPGERIEDNDARLFAFAPYRFHISRPLPAREYRFYWSLHGNPIRSICDADIQPEAIRKSVEVFLKVTTPAGTLHEAFFDPVVNTTTSAVGADDSLGVLKPTDFRVTGYSGLTKVTSTTTVKGLYWRSNKARMEFAGSAPRSELSGSSMDIIGLDGKVSLTLDFDKSTLSPDRRSLVWDVCKQPWKAGDKLMLRIREGMAGIASGPSASSSCAPGVGPGPGPSR